MPLCNKLCPCAALPQDLAPAPTPSTPPYCSKTVGQHHQSISSLATSAPSWGPTEQGQVVDWHP
eukprot:1149360-Pelagomonas_calceolata.AAC.2